MQEEKKNLTPIYVLFALVYFGQGIHYLPDLSIFFYLKDTLGLTVEKMAYLSSLLILPWTIKPIYGLLSDCFPLLGYRRKSYLILSYLTAIAVYIFIYLTGLSFVKYIVSTLLLGICFAMSDVCVDGAAVELGNKYGITGKTQSIQWGAINLASVLTGVLSGYIAEKYSYKEAYLIVCLFLVAGLVYFLLQYKETKNTEKRKIGSIKASLAHPELWLGALFLFLLYFSPSFGTALNFKIVDQLHASKQYLGVIASIGAISSIFGAWLYWGLHKRFCLKTLLYASTIIATGSTLAYLYLPSLMFVTIYAIVFGFVGMISHLVILDYACRITPKGAEAFCFAGICSIMNLGSSASNALGGFLYPRIGMNWLIIVSALTTFSCLFIIPFLKLKESECQTK